MEPIIKEKETVYVDGYGGHGNWGGGNVRGRANAGLTLGIIGTAGAALALARQGGLGGILGGGGAPSTSSVTYNSSVPQTHPVGVYAKECEDVLALTKGMYDLYIVGQQNAAKAREVDVAEKFGLYINNRDSIDKLSDRTNAEFFSLYKYTRDKDDETNAKISALESQVAVNSAIRPYQDKLIQCEIEKVYTALVNYVDRKTCRMISGQLVLPSEPTVTGYSADCFCSRTAAAGAGA